MDNIKEGVYLDIDGSQLMRIFENLISNAAKYSKSNSIFKVSLLEEKETVYMNFENETEGLDSCDIKKIFEKSFRADKARNSEKSETGLGLAICKRIIELHNGEITATYKDKKIKFTIKLRKLTDEKNIF